MEIMEGIKKEMAVKAHRDIMKMGKSLIDDPTCHPETKELIRQEMENSRLRMDAFGLDHA